jgi:septal ring factor EnvC (AmiA/AmiB activator)
MEDKSMLEDKESFWKRKGFYASACVLLVGIMAVGALTYRKLYMNNSGNQMASIATAVPETTPDSTPDGREQEAAQANAQVSDTTSVDDRKAEQKAAETNDAADNETKKDETKNIDTKKTDNTESNQQTPSNSPKTDKTASTSGLVKHSFNEESGLLWPVEGDVILKYSMNNTVYFKTLAQYKCNPAVVISAKEGTEVKAAADCRITKVKEDDELGIVVTTDIGDGYTVSYGQLDNVSVKKGDELKEGDVLGTIAKPTKYYTEEGSNLYFQVKEGNNTVDPLLLLR